MKSFSYWMSECLTDSKAFNLRGKRRKDVLFQIEKMGMKKTKNDYDSTAYASERGPYQNRYGKIFKVTVKYTDTMDLIIKCLGEFSGSWEYVL